MLRAAMAIWRHLAKMENYLDRALESAFQLGKVLLLYLVVRILISRTGRAMVARFEHMERIAEQKPRIRTLGNLIRSVVEYILLIVAILMGLRAIGIDITPILATAGVAGLAVGFGAQRLVRDVISGFFLIAENQFAIGEVVTIGAITGVVEEVGMRTTHLRDEQGRMVVIANGDVNLVINHSRKGGVRVSVDCRVATSADLQQVTDLIQQVAAEVGMKNSVVGVSAFDAASVTLRLSGEVPPHEREACELQVKSHLWQRLREAQVPLV